MKPWSLYKAITINAILLASCCGVPINPHTHSKESYECLSPESIVTDTTGKSLYIADVTARRVTVFDIEANSVKDIIQLKNNPGGIAVAPDGSCVYVASGSSEGMIEIIDLHHGGRMKSIPTGHTPCAPVVSPDGKTVYVCNRFDNSVSVIDLAAKKEIDRIPMLREIDD